MQSLGIETPVQAVRDADEAALSPASLSIDPETAERDIARLVLGLTEFIRELLELRAVSKMEKGQLTPDQEEKLGLALMNAKDVIERLASEFDLSPEDLSLDLGPLGKTI